VVEGRKGDKCEEYEGLDRQYSRYFVVRSIRSAKQVGRELRSSQLMVRNGEASQARTKGG
jgi:hypothetical protein